MDRLDHTNLDYKSCDTDNTLIKRLIEFVVEELHGPMETFFIEHCQKVDPSTQEHDHKYHEYYTRYVDLLEGRLVRFVKDEGLTNRQFFDELEKAESDDPEASQVIQYMLGATDYVRFVDLLCDRHAYYLGPDAEGVLPEGSLIGPGDLSPRGSVPSGK